MRRMPPTQIEVDMFLLFQHCTLTSHEDATAYFRALLASVVDAPTYARMELWRKANADF